MTRSTISNRIHKKGFTIIELIIVISIIAVLAGIVIIGYGGWRRTTVANQVKSDLNGVATAMENLRNFSNGYPTPTLPADITTISGLSSFSPSSGDTLTLAVGSTAKSYCIDATTSQDSSITYYIDSNTSGGPQSGTCGTRTGTDIPSVPTGLAINSVTDTSISLTWSASTNTPSSYVVECATDQAFVAGLQQKSVTTTSGTVTGLAQTTTDYCRVNATNAVGTSAWSAAVNSNTTMTPPVAPTGLAVVAASQTQLNYSWTATATATSYNVQRATNSAFTANLVTVNQTTLTGSSTGLTVATTYYYRIQAVNAGGGGAYSSTVSAMTSPPAVPTGSAVADSGSPASQLDFSWNSVSYASSYTVQYSTSSSMTSPTTITNATSPYDVSGLAAGTTLYFQVESLANGQTNGWSTTVSAISQVPTPTCTASTLNSNRQVTVSWNSVSVATSYTLQYSSNPGFSGATSITGITGTSQAVTGLNNATTYYFQVEALVGATTSTYGACPSATTNVDGPTGYGWYADGYGVRNSGSGTWMKYPGAGNYYSEGMTIYGSCAPGATIVTRLYSYYAYSNNTSQNGGALMDWTWNNQDRFVAGGSGSWKVWWQGWVACQAGGNRQGDVYLGNPGPYT